MWKPTERIRVAGEVPKEKSPSTIAIRRPVGIVNAA